jgi:hypothetical protein
MNYVPQNVRAVVTRNIGSSSTPLSDAIKLLIEEQAHTIQGLAIGFTINGTNGVQERSPVFPQLTAVEQDEKRIQKAIEEWALILAFEAALNNNSTIDVMFFETNDDGTVVVDAWNCTNMFPHIFSGTDGYRQRDYTPEENSEHDVNIEFECTPVRGVNTIVEAQALLDIINTPPEE